LAAPLRFDDLHAGTEQAIERFFRGGEVGGLPGQDWSLRVTCVFRRDGSEWRQVHRHADPLVHPISLEQLSALARG
jgi:ketosteroid isomerase-like protein